MPDIWFYLQEHYTRSQEVSPGVVILHRDEPRTRHWVMHTEKISTGRQVLPIRHDADIALGQLAWPSNADFLRLRLKLRYPFWWNFLKPSRISITVYLSDGTARTLLALVKPNQPSDVWLFPWDEQQLMNYFAPDGENWRSGRPAISRLSLRVSKFDWLSVVPKSVTVEQIDAATVSLN